MDNGLNGSMTERELFDHNVALMSEELGEPITEESLRTASPADLERLAARAKSVSPDRMLMDLQEFQKKAWGFEAQRMIQSTAMRSRF
jgi:hypothetical protein